MIKIKLSEKDRKSLLEKKITDNTDIVKNLMYEMNNICGFDILQKNKENYKVEARAVFWHILAKEYKMTTHFISKCMLGLGYSYNRSNITYSNSRFDIYYNSSDFCSMIYLKATGQHIEKTHKVRTKTELENFLNDVSVERHPELLEIVKLRVKSWGWKESNSYEIIEHN